jgi:hypothetical protein
MSAKSLEEAFELELPGRVRILQTIYAAMLGGVVSAWAIVTWLIMNQQPPPKPDLQLPLLLSVTHAGLAFAAYSVAMVMDRMILKGVNTEESPELQALDWLNQIQTLMITRVALLEGPAFMGFVVVLMSSLCGALKVQPLLWLNAASTAIMAAYVLSRFPSSETFRSVLSSRRTV